MLSLLAAQIIPIIFHKNGNFIIQMQTITFDIVALCGNEIPSPID